MEKHGMQASFRELTHEIEPQSKSSQWDLSFLYEQGIEDPQLKADLEELRAIVAKLEEKEAQLTQVTAQNPSSDELIALLEESTVLEERFTVLSERFYLYVSLQNTTDTQDVQISTLLGLYEQEAAKLAGYTTAYTQAVANCSLEELCKKAVLAPYKHRLERMQETAKHQMSVELENLAAYMDLCGGGAWEQLHSLLTSTLKVPYRDTVMGLDIRDLAYSSDPQVRKDAFEAEYAAYEAIEKPVASALHSLKKQVKYLTKERGFASPLAESAFSEDMSEKTLDALIGAMDQNLELFWRYLSAKAKMMGHKNGLPFYDLFAPAPRDESAYTPQECHDLLVKAFSELHMPIAQLMNRAFAERWVDFFPRDGKVGGAFCCNIPSYERSAVLHNYDSTTSAVLTMAHELGHAYHGKRIEGHKELNREYGMTVAETASTFNETHLVFYLLKHSTSEIERFSALETFLQGITQTVCDIYSRFLFEREVFDRCDSESLDAKALRDIMKRAQMKAYGKSLDHEQLHDNMWIPKGHYYSSSKSFYNYPYAFGALLSMGIYNRIQSGALSMEDYDAFLSATTVASVEDCGAILGIDLSDKGFWEESISAFTPFVEEYEKLAECMGA